jgi:GTP-binding protein Era
VEKEHKSGFVSIIGKPNVGKSTLMNAILGEKISIVTPKAQTTRHQIRGIYTRENCQIVFMDTPGVIDPAYSLQECMMAAVNQSLAGADVLLYITETGMLPDQEFLTVLQKKHKGPAVHVINKIDTTTQEKVEEEIKVWEKEMPDALHIPVCATEGFNIQRLLDEIIEKLPVHPAYFPADDISDRDMRFFVSEIVREKILLLFQKEIPYSVEVKVTEYTEDESIDRIEAIIYVSRESQKSIIIGEGGKAIKKVGVLARKDLEQWIGKQVYISLQVRVAKNWRDDARSLKKFGYTD